MKSYLQIMNNVDHKNVSEETWKSVTEKTHEFVTEMDHMDHAKTEKFLKEIEEELLYPPMTAEEAKQIVAKFKNEDGTTGEHWTMEQVKEAAQHRPELMRFNFEDVYVTLNMMYSDFYSPTFDTNNYIDLAVRFLDDKDAPAGKIRRYLVVLCKRH